jgi:RNA polymerase sigma-70 factor, ECF subfamily
MNDLEAIRSRYGPMIWTTVWRVLRNHAESLDCYQDVFCELLERSGDEQVENWPAFLRWLATRRALDRLRVRRRGQDRFEPDAVDRVAGSSPGPVETAEFHELVEQVRRELAELPDRQAEAFWMAAIEGMTYEEISRCSGIDPSTVGVLIHRARMRLRKSLADLATTEH